MILEAALSAMEKGTYQNTALQGRMDLPSIGDQPPSSKPAQALLIQWKKPRKAFLTSLRK